MRAFCGVTALLTFTAAAPAFADSEASNVPRIATDEWGRCFAHSIPDDFYDVGGRTDVYLVGDNRLLGDGLTPVHSYDWYAQQLYVACNASDGEGARGPAVVQLGPWPRGQKPNDETLAIAFHFNGETIATYSTLDIADGDPANASCSVSHYTVIDEVVGFERAYGENPSFLVTTVDGRRLTFNAVTGALVNTEKGEPRYSFGECWTGE